MHNESKLQDKINFQKMAIVAPILQEVLRLQQVHYPFEHNPSLQQFMENVVVFDSEDLWQKSVQCEPNLDDAKRRSST
jgi:hypothetical protein